MITTKTLIANKEWLLKDKEEKIGSISKSKKGYNFFRKGHKIPLKNMATVKETFGVDLMDTTPIPKFEMQPAVYTIYDYPCGSRPYQPVYNLKKKLPLFAKSGKSKSQYCAGYYIIKFRKGWVKSFCPKLITLERYPFHGPYKTEVEMKTMLNNVNKS